MAAVRAILCGWPRPLALVLLSPEDRARLTAVIGNRDSPQKHVQRARIVLLSADRLYMEPPCHPVVLSIDEKSQFQALDRTQPGLRR